VQTDGNISKNLRRKERKKRRVSWNSLLSGDYQDKEEKGVGGGRSASQSNRLRCLEQEREEGWGQVPPDSEIKHLLDLRRKGDSEGMSKERKGGSSAPREKPRPGRKN